MSETFLPIPSLNNLYEIDKRGIVRNAKTKHIIQPVVSVKQDGKYISKSVNILLWEVHGIRRKDAYTKNIPVSVQKDNEVYYFESFRQCAKFLSKREKYCITTPLTYLRKRREVIFDWQINYFDEPKGRYK